MKFLIEFNFTKKVMNLKTKLTFQNISIPSTLIIIRVRMNIINLKIAIKVKLFIEIQIILHKREE